MKTNNSARHCRSNLCRFLVAAAAFLAVPGAGWAQAPASIKLNAPDLKRGLPFMETLSVKASAQAWSDRELSLQDLSDLLWAANGINRPAEKKTTASSAQNAQDVDMYVFLKDGIYTYDVANHALTLVASGDHRAEVTPPPPARPAAAGGVQQPARPAPTIPPVLIVLVSNTARFRSGAPELRREWGAIDTGIVSQNISLFCATTGLKTRPRASMDREKIRTLLKLEDTQYAFLNHPVGYAR